MDADSEVLSSGREPSGSGTPGGERARHPWSPVRRLVAAVLAVALLAGVGAVLWRRAHPAPLVLPAVQVRLDPSEYLLPHLQGPGNDLHLLLLLHVSVTARPGEQPAGALRVVGVYGGGVTSTDRHDVPGAAAGPGGRVAVDTSLSCQDWANGSGVRVRLEVAADGRTATTTAPLDLGPGSPVHAQIDEVCGQYVQTHPLRVVAVTSALDPIRPTVRLDWTVHNPTDRVLVVGEATGLSDQADPAPDVRPEPAEDPLTLVPGATGHVRSTLEVTSCQEASFDPGGADVTLTVREPGTGDDVADMSVSVPTAALTEAFAASARACRGAPLLLSPAVSLSVRHAPGAAGGGARSVAATLSAQVAADGRWTATFARPEWFGGPDSARPFRDGDSTVDAPGDLVLVGHWTAPTCAALANLLAPGSTVPVVLEGGRDYPYPVQVVNRSDPTGCRLG